MPHRYGNLPGHTGSHSVTCHLTEVTFLPLPQPIKAGTRFSISRGMQGWVYLVNLVTYWGGILIQRWSPIALLTGLNVEQLRSCHAWHYCYGQAEKFGEVCKCAIRDMLAHIIILHSAISHCKIKHLQRWTEQSQKQTDKFIHTKKNKTTTKMEKLKSNKKRLKNVGPIRHCEPPHAPFTRSRYWRRLRIDVHDNANDDDDNDNNDNAWQRGPLWPHRMGPIKTRENYLNCKCAPTWPVPLSFVRSVVPTVSPDTQLPRLHSRLHTHHHVVRKTYYTVLWNNPVCCGWDQSVQLTSSWLVAATANWVALQCTLSSNKTSSHEIG